LLSVGRADYRQSNNTYYAFGSTPTIGRKDGRARGCCVRALVQHIIRLYIHTRTRTPDSRSRYVRARYNTFSYTRIYTCVAPVGESVAEKERRGRKVIGRRVLHGTPLSAINGSGSVRVHCARARARGPQRSGHPHFVH